MKKILLTCFMLVFVLYAWAQDRTVSGKVTDANTGEGLPGVNVLLKGTGTGVNTDLDGNYKISVPSDGGTLVFSFIGMTKQEVNVGARSVVDIQMVTDVQQLSEVIVTGIGVERQAKSLGYSTQNLDAEEITKAANTNLLNSLQGKVAGVQISQSTGALGGATRIVVRGPASFTNGNQPLFVIDGVPIDNTQRQSTDLRSGPSFSNSGVDINPDDIASMTVLKGPSAAALYGSRAANGVILITTKSGKGTDGKMAISINSSVTFDNVLRYPDFQRTYASGSGGVYNPEGFTGWGPEFDGQTVRNPNNEWDGQPDSVSLTAKDQFLEQFLKTGTTISNSISVSGGKEDTHYRMSFSNATSEGIVPSTDLTRTTASIKASTKLANNFRSEVSATYTLTESGNLPPAGQTQASFMWQALYTGVDLDISPWTTYEAPDGSQLEYGSGFWNNPYWVVNKNRTSQRRDRVNGKALLGYEFAEGIELIARVGTDVYVDARKGRIAINTVGNVDGGFYEDQFVYNQLNTDVFLNVNKNVSEDFNISGILGINDNRRSVKNVFSSAGAIVVPDLYNYSNIDGQPTAQNNLTERRLFGAYGNINLGYKDWAFLDFTARNDWSSTLPEGNNSFFYPSVSGSVILTEAVPALENDYMTYLKLRGNWGQVGNDANPYVLNSVYGQGAAFDGLFNGINFPFNGVTGFTAGNRIGTPDLQPEITTSWELGAEIGFWDDRLTLDATYFDSKSTNQIFNVNIAPSSGYTAVTRNAGLMTNKGVELLLTGTPVRTNSGFRWDIQANWTKIDNKVEELFADLEQLNVGRAGFVSVSSVAYLGQPYPVIYGRSWRRNDAGDIIVSAQTGLPELTSEQNPVAKVIPDWTGGIRNNFSFKGIDLSILFEMRKGGSIYSSSTAHWRVNGFAKETELGRESGLVFNGVNEVIGNEGDTSYVNNNFVVDNESFWSSFSLFGDTELGLVDASFIKLREVSLGYALPKSILERTPFGSVYASVVGRNLWLNTPNPYIDPEVSMFGAADNQGYEYATIPSTKSWGFNLKFTF
ncbi:SusC/RagA family TonB-linked outer membrane protein [Marivirga sp. S37H4]|uniref:SusC/RagA family TonB-linked outer membrane protein n=1 Tax=Marivirga aurantiaca TaxID=2802615 RepID=A0A934WYM2_9BACT|nr:SusC/RagA family TonB-linked outer membrane protein [Marivirga aurantiaca]MBK6265230.1 SusC/RagA family TonB-linked outer membrane protein [Marivirga aurantiaca]